MTEKRFLTTILTEGTFLMILGIIMFILPKITNITFNSMISLAFFSYGGYRIINAVMLRNFSRHYVLTIISGIILTMCGIMLYFIEFIDIICITSLVGIYFIFESLSAMKKVFAGIIFSVLVLAQILVSAEAPQVNYQAYVANLGWQNSVKNGEIAGTTGQAQRMEAVRINLAGVEYRAHVQNIGWQEWKKSGEIAGTTGNNLRMEAICIRLTGSAADRYDIYYRAHVQNGGWLGWAKNGDPAGSAGVKLRMEALQIQIVPKGTNVQVGGRAFYEPRKTVPTV